MQRTLSLLALALAATAAQAADTTKLTVNGMVCAFCAQGIEKRLSALPQTQAVYVNLGKKIVAVQAKEGQTLDAAVLRHEITEAGYDVVKVEASTEPVSAIRATLAKKK
ncbi:MAG: heavy metal-associated domain-containing protein [Pseudomonadota bacterium]